MKKLLAMPLLFLAISAQAANDVPMTIRNATPAEIDLIREGMQEKLKDADSAKFRNVHVFVSSIEEFCGEVNSKNSMAAYVGYHAFEGFLFTNQTDHVINGKAPGEKTAAIFMIDDDDSSSMAKICSKKLKQSAASVTE